MNFRPGSRNVDLLTKPFAEIAVAGNGSVTSARVLRWTRNVRLASDALVHAPKRYGLRLRYHELKCKKHKRLSREKFGRKWQVEVRNTAEIALWWRFRVNATTDYDKEIYDKYLENKKQERIASYKRDQTYQPWILSNMAIDNSARIQKHIVSKSASNKSPEEIKYLLSLKPEYFLENLRTEFSEDEMYINEGFIQWKNDYQINRNKNENQMSDIIGQDMFGFDWFMNCEKYRKVKIGMNKYEKYGIKEKILVNDENVRNVEIEDESEDDEEQTHFVHEERPYENILNEQREDDRQMLKKILQSLV